MPFLVAGPTVWDLLPDNSEILAARETSFRQSLKTFLGSVNMSSTLEVYTMNDNLKTLLIVVNG